MIRGSKLRKELAPQIIKDRKVRAEFVKIATSLFIKEKARMLKNFDTHPVTRELRGGANSPNLSGTVPRGNLFGFMGFPAGDDVISELRGALGKINIKPKFERATLGERIFTVNIPTPEDLYAITPLPWASGRSWLYGIEYGMSGLGKYMYITDAPTSRSGVGIQSETKTSEGALTGVTYLTNGGILDEFRDALTKLSSGGRSIITN